MKNILKIVLVILAIIILLVGAVFLIKPVHWMNLLKPIELNITTVNTKISETDISTDIKVELSTDYFMDFMIDSLAYEFYLDSTKIAHGSTVIDKNFRPKDKDTLTIPLSIHKDTLTSKLDSLAPTDSTKVRFLFTNYVELPVLGKTAFEFEINKKIPAPKLPKIKIENIDTVKLLDAKFRIEFEIENPNMYELTINRFDADIKFEKLFTGKIKNNTPIKLKPQGTTIFLTTIDVDDLNLIKDGLKLLFQANKEWAYTMNAKITVQQKGGATIDLAILNSGKMDIIGKR